MKKTKTNNFTLIEVLVASLLLTVMITGLTIVSSNLNSSWQRSSAINKELQELINVERVLDNSMPNAIPFVWRERDDFKQRISTFTGEPDRIAFCYLHRLNNLEEGAIRFIGLLQEDDQLVAYHKNRPWVNLDELSDETLERTVIADGIQSVKFQYAISTVDINEEVIEWEDEWDDDDESRFDIPLGFRIDITWSRDDGVTETFLYRTAGNSKYQRWGDWKPDKTIGGGGSGDKDDGGPSKGTPESGDDPIDSGPCFVTDTLVSTPNGYSFINNFIAGDQVHGFNNKNQVCYIDQVEKISVHDVENHDIYKIRTATETISVTGNHKFKTRHGKTLAENIKAGDNLLSLNKRDIEVLEVTKSVYTGKVYNLVMKVGSKYSVGVEGVVVYH